jgi:hypothetical protein
VLLTRPFTWLCKPVMMQAFDAEQTGYATYARRNSVPLAASAIHVRRLDVRAVPSAHVSALILGEDEKDVRRGRNERGGEGQEKQKKLHATGG